jgi:hypothetical protein
MDTAQVVSNPNDAAIAQGGSIALKDTDHFAVTLGDNSPAVQDADNVAFVGAGNSAQAVTDSAVAQGSQAVNNSNNNAIAESGIAAYQTGGGAIVQNGGNAIGTVSSGAASIGGQANYQSGASTNNNNNGNGNIAVGTVTTSPINVGSGNSALQQAPTGPAALNQGSGIANAGNMGTSSITDTGNTVTVSPTATITLPGGAGTPPAATLNSINTVAVTQLKQVNAGISIGNGNNLYGAGALINQNSTNSASNGVMASSASIGVAANSAAQNVVNVSANITQNQK